MSFGSAEPSVSGKRERREREKKIAAVGWGAFFVWLGFILMIKAGSGAILIGVGVISLCVQVVRKYAGLESEGLWILVAILFIVVGVWEVLEVRIPLMSLLLIVVGAAFILSAVRRKSNSR
ncbi:MAG: hypothetical protein P1S46_06100 [bacterium]|nr:hypothetical protein [bacterium]MDT8395581.1 hypothetical protein [bacterium]